MSTPGHAMTHPTDGRASSPDTALPWLGANFWSRSGGPRMWSRYDGALVREELAVLVEHGLDTTRSFCFWPDFVPKPETIDEDVAARFADFLDAHLETGMRTIPTFLVGHMSGENWDPAWRHGRDLYRDVWMVSQQAWFAAEIARRFGGHEAVCAWLVSNEMPLYGGRGSADEITAWARIVVQAVRSAGATQPISLGDGAWGIEVTGADNGFSLRRLAPLVDFVGPHSYPMQDDELRQLLSPAFACELSDGFGKPVVLEEFGVTSDFASDGNAAAYYRQVLHTTLLAGARGWLAWNNTDFDGLRDEDPYRHHVFELHFGLTDSSGRPKETLRSMGAFSSVLRSLPEDWEVERGAAAIVVPEHFERELPFSDPAYRSDIRDQLLQAYVAAREADLPLGLVRERDGLETDARLLLAPCAKLLTGPGLDRLRILTEGGATLYLSYFAGSTTNQRGPWLSWLPELFGVEHRLRYGLVDPIEDDEVVLELVADLGELSAGTRLAFTVSGEPSARAHLPVEAVGAETVAIDSYGRPALLRHRLAAGQTVLCTYPLEHMAARTPWANPENTWRIYSALASLAGVERRVRVDDPQVLAGVLRGDGRDTAVLVNCSSSAVSLQPVDPHRAGDATTWPLVIEPRSATTLVLDPAADGDGRQQPTLELAASPLTKGGMPTSDLRPTHEAR
jgi:endo-1,4-beta-mannosidase